MFSSRECKKYEYSKLIFIIDQVIGAIFLNLSATLFQNFLVTLALRRRSTIIQVDRQML